MQDTSHLPHVTLAGPADNFTPAVGESARAFEAFQAYLALGPARRYFTVGRQVGASLRTIKRWVKDFDWRGRLRSVAARSARQFVVAQAAARDAELREAAPRKRMPRQA